VAEIGSNGARVDAGDVNAISGFLLRFLMWEQIGVGTGAGLGVGWREAVADMGERALGD
jgi:hypothetical protein